MKEIKNILNYKFEAGETFSIDVKSILIMILLLLLASYFLKACKKLIVKRLERENKNKFDTIFSFGSWFVYTIIFLIVLQTSGVNLSAVFAASAALLVGLGLALQTFFQDIISGIFIIVDQSVHVGDIIQMDGKVGRVEEIKLRTTRAVTYDNKVIIIPNHLYLTKSLYNWTQNGSQTRENVTVGVAYGSDTELVKSLLIKAANENSNVLKNPPPLVLFTNFGDSALEFKLIFTLNDSFVGSVPKSEIRFAIDKLFREHNISIPFPQRDIHIVKE